MYDNAWGFCNLIVVCLLFYMFLFYQLLGRIMAPAPTLLREGDAKTSTGKESQEEAPDLSPSLLLLVRMSLLCPNLNDNATIIIFIIFIIILIILIIIISIIMWSKVLPLTASCLSPLPRFESLLGHVRKLPVTWY